MSIKITPAAKEMLVTLARKGESESGYTSLIPAILWAGDAKGENFEWSIGFYEKARIVSDWLVTLDGVRFYVDPVDLPKLDGYTLNYVNKKFQFVKPQNH